MKSFLIILQHNPYKNSFALEGLEFALALSSFEQSVSLLLKGEGTLQLLATQESDKLIGKDFTRIYTDLKLFGIEKIYIDHASMHELEPSELSVIPEVVDQEQIARLIKEHSVVLTL